MQCDCGMAKYSVLVLSMDTAKNPGEMFRTRMNKVVIDGNSTNLLAIAPTPRGALTRLCHIYYKITYTQQCEVSASGITAHNITQGGGMHITSLDIT